MATVGTALYTVLKPLTPVIVICFAGYPRPSEFVILLLNSPELWAAPGFHRHPGCGRTKTPSTSDLSSEAGVKESAGQSLEWSVNEPAVLSKVEVVFCKVWDELDSVQRMSCASRPGYLLRIERGWEKRAGTMNSGGGAEGSNQG